MRRTILLATAMGFALLVASSLALVVGVAGGGLSTAQAQSTDLDKESADKHADHKQGSKATKSGIFAYITGGETLSGDHEHQVEYFIIDEQGKETKLQLADEAVLQEGLKDLGVSREKLKDGGPQPLVGKRVTIEGRWTSNDAEGERGSGGDKIKVENIQPEQSDN